MAKKTMLKLYRGYGHTHDMVLFGHVLAGTPKQLNVKSTNAFINLFQLLRLFFVNPVGKRTVTTSWQGQTIEAVSEDDGFFILEWQAAESTAAGTHHLPVSLQHATTDTEKQGKIVVPHLTQYAFISDIDDTVMVSHSATSFKRMKELLFKSPAQRKVFEDVALHYQLLALSHTIPTQPNPFFYVSSSEWNLYDYLVTFFTLNNLPNGSFLLSQIKKWHQLFKTGKTKHEGKLLRINRLFVHFPLQRFVLFGDNSQSDPFIYETLTKKYSDRIAAVYIRNVAKVNEEVTAAILKKIEALNIAVLQFKHSGEAIAHSKAIGLINVEEGLVINDD